MKICKVDNCGRKHQARGFCSKCYSLEKRKKGGSFTDKICSVDGCKGKHEAKGLCSKHYQRLRDTDSLVLKEKQDTCSIDGCNKQHNAKGFCVIHYRRYKLYGDPLCVKIEYHGLRKTKEYTTWSSMIQRCTNPNHNSYLSYGGRGISIHKEWRDSFLSFLDYIGKAPSKKHSLDRIDVNGNYEPGNVRWATSEQQSRNTRAYSKSGHKGVYFCKKTGIWRARIYVNGKNLCLKRYKDINDAITARKKAEEKYWSDDK